MSNVTTAVIDRFRRARTAALYQYDYGQILRIRGVTLPAVFEVHFAGASDSTTITMIGSDDQVEIPDEYLQRGTDITAYVYLHEGEDDGETEYRITIPVMARPEPSNEEPTPVQQDAITQAIAALNDAVEQTAADVISADASALAAEESATDANADALRSEGYAVGTQDGDDVSSDSVYYHNNAIYYSNQAAADASGAEISALKAEGYAVGQQGGADVSSGTYYHNSAKYYKEQAAASESAAAGSETAAGRAKDDAVAAKDAAQTAQSGAETSALRSEGYAVGTQDGTAVGSGSPYYHNSAKYYKEQAAQSATSAGTALSDAVDAKNAAQTAQGKAEDAQSAAETAQGKAEDAQEAAEDAQTAAETAQGAAEGARDDIQDSIDGVAQEDTAQDIKAVLDTVVTLLQTIVGNTQSIAWYDELPVSGIDGYTYITPDGVYHYDDGEFVQVSGGGDLNGFGLALGEDDQVILSYTNPEDDTDTGSAVLPTDDTAQTILTMLTSLADHVRQIAGGEDE